MSQKYIKSQNKNSHNAKSFGQYYAKSLLKDVAFAESIFRPFSKVHKAFALRVNLDYLSADALKGET